MGQGGIAALVQIGQDKGAMQILDLHFLPFAPLLLLSQLNGWKLPFTKVSIIHFPTLSATH